MKTPPRLPTELIDKVRDANPLLIYLAGIGPFVSHNDSTATVHCVRCKKPNLVVHKYQHVCKCFACGFAGNVYTVHMEKAGADFRTAVFDLADKAGIEIDEQYRNPPQDAL